MNMRLSMGRAGAVQHYLARKGVSPMRVRARDLVRRATCAEYNA